MPRPLQTALAAVLSAALASAALAAERHPKAHVTVRPATGVGFLPGYRSPDQIAREEKRNERYEYHPNYYYWGGHYYIGAPGFYRGRYNGGSLGPCYKWTPIGAMWTCG